MNDDPDAYDSATDLAATVDTADGDHHGQLPDTGVCGGCGGDGWRGERVQCKRCAGRGWL